jgi:hypothetical protein
MSPRTVAPSDLTVSNAIPPRRLRVQPERASTYASGLDLRLLGPGVEIDSFRPLSSLGGLDRRNSHVPFHPPIRSSAGRSYQAHRGNHRRLVRLRAGRQQRSADARSSSKYVLCAHGCGPRSRILRVPGDVYCSQRQNIRGRADTGFKPFILLLKWLKAVSRHAFHLRRARIERRLSGRCNLYSLLTHLSFLLSTYGLKSKP